ncbi:hypothetical protein RyT2_24970 [Pseudolactococcus yaeyamensis]
MTRRADGLTREEILEGFIFSTKAANSGYREGLKFKTREQIGES